MTTQSPPERTAQTVNPLLDGYAFADLAQVEAMIGEAIAHRRPFSLMRFNDGEGCFLGTGEAEPPKRAMIQRTWFGENPIPPSQLDAIAARTVDAFRDADILGVATHAEPGTLYHYGLTSAFHHGIIRRETTLANAMIHNMLWRNGALKALLADQPFVGLVTGRNVREHVAREYGVGRVSQILVPAEAGHTFADLAMPHFPDRFHEVERLIDPPHCGAVYLVGAGILGKIYCHIIKSRGGIALDLGSVFDLMAKMRTRDFMRAWRPGDPTELARDHPRLLRHLGDLRRPKTYLAVAQELVTAGRMPLAITVLLWGTCAHPRNGDLRERLAVLLARGGYSRRAVEEAKAAVASKQGTGLAQEVLARLGDTPPDRDETPLARFDQRSNQRRALDWLRRRLT